MKVTSQSHQIGTNPVVMRRMEMSHYREARNTGVAAVKTMTAVETVIETDHHPAETVIKTETGEAKIVQNAANRRVEVNVTSPTVIHMGDIATLEIRTNLVVVGTGPSRMSVVRRNDVNRQMIGGEEATTTQIRSLQAKGTPKGMIIRDHRLLIGTKMIVTDPNLIVEIEVNTVPEKIRMDGNEIGRMATIITYRTTEIIAVDGKKKVTNVAIVTAILVAVKRTLILSMNGVLLGIQTEELKRQISIPIETTALLPMIVVVLLTADSMTTLVAGEVIMAVAVLRLLDLLVGTARDRALV